MAEHARRLTKVKRIKSLKAEGRTLQERADVTV
jgi:hypothetical protein